MDGVYVMRLYKLDRNGKRIAGLLILMISCVQERVRTR